MTENLTTVAAEATAEAEESTRVTRALLACGAVAGPLFVVVALVQVLTRDGFDLRRHPISLMGVGDLGWIQITNFVAAGLLSVGFAVGMWRVLHPGRGGTWGPLLVAGFGTGLVAGGVFVPDPALGFPAGAPEGIPDDLSWHAVLHAVAPPVAFLSLILTCFVFVRRFVGLRRRGWAAYSGATGMIALVLSARPGRCQRAPGGRHHGGLRLGVGPGGPPAHGAHRDDEDTLSADRQRLVWRAPHLR